MYASTDPSCQICNHHTVSRCRWGGLRSPRCTSQLAPAATVHNANQRSSGIKEVCVVHLPPHPASPPQLRCPHAHLLGSYFSSFPFCDSFSQTWASPTLRDARGPGSWGIHSNRARWFPPERYFVSFLSALTKICCSITLSF